MSSCGSSAHRSRCQKSLRCDEAAIPTRQCPKVCTRDSLIGRSARSFRIHNLALGAGQVQGMMKPTLAEEARVLARTPRRDSRGSRARALDRAATGPAAGPQPPPPRFRLARPDSNQGQSGEVPLGDRAPTHGLAVVPATAPRLQSGCERVDHDAEDQVGDLG